jgi:excisionase family DNA binding protein
MLLLAGRLRRQLLPHHIFSAIPFHLYEIIGVNTIKTDIDRTEYVTPEQIARRHVVCLETVHRRIRSGELPAMRIGRLWRVPVAELVRFEKAKTIGGTGGVLP